MPVSYPQKIQEIAEVLDKLFDGGYIDKEERDFSAEMAKLLQKSGAKGIDLTDKQRRNIDYIYYKACESPY